MTDRDTTNPLADVPPPLGPTEAARFFHRDGYVICLDQGTACGGVYDRVVGVWTLWTPVDALELAELATRYIAQHRQRQAVSMN